MRLNHALLHMSIHKLFGIICVLLLTQIFEKLSIWYPVPGSNVINSVTRKSCQMSIKVAQNDFTKNMIDFDTFTKIA